MGIDAKLFDIVNKRSYHIGRYYKFDILFEKLDPYSGTGYRLFTSEGLIEIAEELSSSDLGYLESAITLRNVAQSYPDGLYLIISEDDSMYDDIDQLMVYSNKKTLISDLMLWVAEIDKQEVVDSDTKRNLYIIKSTVDKILKKYETLPHSDATMEELEAKYKYEEKDKTNGL